MVTHGLTYSLWDYSAHKSSIYLLREGQIHIPSADTWAAEERELHCLASLSSLAGALPAMLLWLWEAHLVGEC